MGTKRRLATIDCTNPVIDEARLVEKSFDFHKFEGQRLAIDEIREKTLKFLRECIGCRFRKVEIITGRGNHSRNGGPVIQPTVRALLEEVRGKLVKKFRETSSGGAFEVILKR
jgi:DNA-nicking Smr family endonuclease